MKIRTVVRNFVSRLPGPKAEAGNVVHENECYELHFIDNTYVYVESSCVLNFGIRRRKIKYKNVEDM